ncbi:hypothetical protein FRC18_009061 [Serendipita sp. 400]|nr:hypothetical protein FRC18_009061 [Serendipita sp. 400]
MADDVKQTGSFTPIYPTSLRTFATYQPLLNSTVSLSLRLATHLTSVPLFSVFALRLRLRLRRQLAATPSRSSNTIFLKRHLVNPYSFTFLPFHTVLSPPSLQQPHLSPFVRLSHLVSLSPLSSSSCFVYQSVYRPLVCSFARPVLSRIVS